MNKLKFTSFVFLLALGLFSFASCSGDDSGEGSEENTEQKDEKDAENDNDKQETNSHVMYQCPDNCNEGRAFFDAGSCEKCGQEMVEI